MGVPGLAVMSLSNGNERDNSKCKVFNGNDEDGKELKRWINWANGHLNSSRLKPDQYRNRIYTFLDGEALKVFS